MRLNFVGFVGAFAVALVLLGPSLSAQTVRSTPTPGPLSAEEGEFRRQIWLTPGPAENVVIRATLFRPPGPGPFPLAVINHGSTQNVERRARFRTGLFNAASRFFLERGYAVLVPQRPGHGETGGPYLEDQGGCENADFFRAGIATAASIQSAIEFMTKQPFIHKRGILVVGQSAGGWGALALASSNPVSVRAVLNFAGGRGGRSFDQPNNNCAPERLVAAAGEFGRTARTPTLWIYTQNDTFFGPELSRRMSEAFRNAGGRVTYRLLPPFGEDGHTMFESSEAVKIWGPLVDKFLAGER